MAIDTSLPERIAAAKAARDASGESIPISTGGGGGPYDPSMETRMGKLEADMREVRSSLKGLELSSTRLEATLVTLASTSDIVGVTGSVNVLTARIDAQTLRLSALEETNKTTISTALSKTIGLGGAITLFVALTSFVGIVIAFFRYLHII